MSEFPLEATAVEKTYPGGVRALRGVTFRISAGEHACLLGPNGAGKTTLIRILMGAFQPTAGSARLFGHQPEDAGFLKARRRVGIVPQMPGMYRDLRCREYLGWVRDMYGHGDVEEITTAFRLAEFLERPMASLSGGQQRRLSLAAAVLAKPDVLLLDEPTVGLDPVATREVHTWLKEMMKGRTVLLCTHNLAEAEALCETVIILRNGKSLVHEPLTDLRRQAGPRLALAAREGNGALAEALTRRGLSPDANEAHVRVTCADPRAEAPALLKALMDEGLHVYECRVEQPTLEELFLKIVGGADEGA